MHIKQICSETSEVIKNLKDLKDAFIKRGYYSKILDHHFERAMNVDRKILLENKEKPSNQGNLPLVLTYNKTLPNIQNVRDKDWYILSINENLPEVFDKRHSLLIEKHQFVPTNWRQPHRTRKNRNNQEIAHHATKTEKSLL